MPMRITGLTSGLDTESIISELTKAYSKKTEKYKKAQTTIEWKQDAWKSLNSKIYSLYKNVSNLRFSSAYSTKKVTVGDPSKATASTDGTAVNGSQKLNVLSTAQAAYLTSGKLINQSSDSALNSRSSMSELGYTGDNTSIYVKTKDANGAEKETEIKITKNTEIGDVVKALQGAGLTANFDEKNGRLFVSSKDTGTAGNFKIVAKTDTVKDSETGKSVTKTNENSQKALEALGLSTSSYMTSGAMKVSSVSAFKGITNDTKMSDLGIDGEVTLKFSVGNGSSEGVTVTGDTTIKDLLDEIKNKYGVEATFDGEDGLLIDQKEATLVFADEDYGEDVTARHKAAQLLHAMGSTTDYVTLEDLGYNGNEVKFTAQYTDLGGTTKSTEEITMSKDKTIAELLEELRSKGVTNVEYDPSQGLVSGGKALKLSFVQETSTEASSNSQEQSASGGVSDPENASGGEGTSGAGGTSEGEGASGTGGTSEGEGASGTGGATEGESVSGEESTAEEEEKLSGEALNFLQALGMEKKTMSSDLSLLDVGYVGARTSFSLNIKGQNNPFKITLGRTDTVQYVVDQLQDAFINAGMKDNEVRFDAETGKITIKGSTTDASEEFTLSADSDDPNSMKLMNALGLSKAQYKDAGNQLDGVDAQIRLNGVLFTSTTNNFTVNGLNITTTGITGDGDDKAITVTTDTDTSSIYDKVKDFLTEYNNLVNEMTKLYNADSSKGYEPLTDEEKDAMSDTEIQKWETKIKDSLLRRDSTLESVLSTMINSMAKTYQVGGKTYSLSSFGIHTMGFLNAAKNEQNAYHIDGDEDDSNTSGNQDKLMTAIREDPDAVIEFLKQLTSGLYTSIDGKMKSTTLSSAYTVYNDKELKTQYDDYTKTIKKWENKATSQEDFYYKQFARMEKAMSTLQSQTQNITGLFS